MKKKLLFLGLNALYSILGWLICIVQIGESMIMHFNQCLIIVLAALQIFVGLFVNLFLYQLKKDVEITQNYKKLLLIDCAIIILPYFLIILLWIVGWF